MSGFQIASEKQFEKQYRFQMPLEYWKFFVEPIIKKHINFVQK
jgi:hypothetical protein